MSDSTIDHFKCDVRRFDTIDNEIKMINENMKPLQEKLKPYQNRLKELKTTKKELENTICSFMESNEIGECKLQEGALLFKETKNVVPLIKENIKNNIVKFFNECDDDEFKKAKPDEKANILFKFIYENREYKENKTLKRV